MKLFISKIKKSIVTFDFNSRCRIRLDNLKLKRTFFLNSFFSKFPPLFYGLEIFFWGSSKVFVVFVLDMYFLHFEALWMKWVLFLLKFLLTKSVEVFFPTYCFDYQVWRCYQVIYYYLLFFPKKSDRLLA